MEFAAGFFAGAALGGLATLVLLTLTVGGSRIEVEQKAYLRGRNHGYWDCVEDNK